MVGKHALKNAMIPVVTVIGIIFSLLLSGSVVIETVFSIPGVGSLLGSAILRRDYPVIQGGLLLTATMLLLLNLRGRRALRLCSIRGCATAMANETLRAGAAPAGLARPARGAPAAALSVAAPPAPPPPVHHRLDLLVLIVVAGGAPRRPDHRGRPPEAARSATASSRRARTGCSAPTTSAAASGAGSIYGARLSLLIGLGVVLLNAVFGTLLGALAGYFRRLDNVLMRIDGRLHGLPGDPARDRHHGGARARARSTR